ncbi:hypothetical protein BDZ45DRAFT_679673 [Acephala macrosclerotiorum]|nr:hypothetical protein BDZ45DRAFT_679673 [Acephala macrosclerotiorum]
MSSVMVATATRVVCTCDKSFKDASAMLQHQRDSPRHRTAPQSIPSEQFAASQPPPQYLNDLVGRLSLQDAADDHLFIPLSARGNRCSTSFHVQNPRLNFLKPRFAGRHAPSSTAGNKAGNRKNDFKATQNGNKKTTVGKTAMNSGLDEGWLVHSNWASSRGMSQDQNWGLCDKDCGWCGHCGDGIL